MLYLTEFCKKNADLKRFEILGWKGMKFKKVSSNVQRDIFSLTQSIDDSPSRLLDHQNASTGGYFYTINSTDNQTKCLCLKLRPPYKN